MAIGASESPHTPEFPDLPDLVIDKTLQLLPTKAAFQACFLSKNWQGVVSSCPSLNFDEDDDFDRHSLKRYSHYQLQHIRFSYFLKGYLDYLEKNGQKELLHRLRLHMSVYGHQDASIIAKWLEYACRRGLKELDIGLKMSDDPKRYGNSLSEKPVEIYPDDYEDFYRLPLRAIASAKSLTPLKLESVRVPGLWQEYDGLFPSLKNLSFTLVRVVNGQDLHSVLSQCPSIEYVSLSHCWFENSWKLSLAGLMIFKLMTPSVLNLSHIFHCHMGIVKG